MAKKSAATEETQSEEQPDLDEEFNLSLTIYNPYVSQNCVEFDHKSKCFKPVLDFKKPVVYHRNVGTTKRRLEGSYGVIYEEVAVRGEGLKNVLASPSVGTSVGCLVPQRDQSENIDPALCLILKFQGSASKSEILAAYEEYEKKKKKAEGRNDNEKWFMGDLKTTLMFTGKQELVFHDNDRKDLRQIERILDQNTTEANLDFSYYDDPSDEQKPNSGSLLPLWKLRCGLTRNAPVSAVAWSPHMPDMLAVGHSGRGQDEDDPSPDCEQGFVCVFSLKGPSHPERVIECPEGVSCVSFHPQLRHLVAVSLSGGTFEVYDLRMKDSNLPQGRDSKFQTWAHHDKVTEVEWLPDQVPQKLFSISYDGKLISWLFLKDDLFPDLVTVLRLMRDWHLDPLPMGLDTNLEPKTGGNLGLNTCGTAISVNPQDSSSFLIGTEIGLVHKGTFGNKGFHGVAFSDHAARVRKVHWNRLHPGVFITCGNDLTLQVWDSTYEKPVFSFFFENEVEDVAWAPYSTSVFAAVTSGSKVSVFDLSLNKRAAVGSYVVYTKKQHIALTRIDFNPAKAVLAVGDERGCVTTFKLSPNMRTSLKAMKTLEKPKFISGEIAKMDRLMTAAKVEARN